jgi:hypothetical protein
MTSRIIVVLVALFVAVPASAQELTREQVEQAIESGRNMRPENIGYRTDLRHWRYTGSENFWVMVHTPITRIQLAAAEANLRFKTFTAADVTAEMKAPVLTLMTNFRMNHAVLRDKAKEVVVQPTGELRLCGEFGQLFRFGREHSQECAMFQYPLSKAAKVMGDEFFINMTFASRSSWDGELVDGGRELKVKRGDLSKLPVR